MPPTLVTSAMPGPPRIDGHRQEDGQWNPGVSTFAVLGGTAAYSGASGEATLTDAESTEFVIDLG